MSVHSQKALTVLRCPCCRTPVPKNMSPKSCTYFDILVLGVVCEECGGVYIASWEGGVGWVLRRFV